MEMRETYSTKSGTRPLLLLLLQLLLLLLKMAFCIQA
jgi:hypothetical protein